MKATTKVITAPKQVTDIDWSKPQWMIAEDGQIVLSTGYNYTGYLFEAVSISGGDYESGHYSKEWAKDAFTPITTPITIEISNTND